jgi:hypothetical protein
MFQMKSAIHFIGDRLSAQLAWRSIHFNLCAPAEHCECSVERLDLGRVLWVEHAPCLFLVHLHATRELGFRDPGVAPCDVESSRTTLRDYRGN